MSDQNLSEVLFKPKFDYPETSMISNSGADLPALTRQDKMLGFNKHYYRPLYRYLWGLSGGNPLDIDEALANITVSTNERNREKCFDTVRTYGPGNWIYEFNSIAQKRVLKAHECEKNNDLVKASHNYRIASRYYAIAAYPNLKGDVLALESDAMCRTYYKKMFETDTSFGYLSEETFEVDGKKVTGYLHLPDKDTIHPCVVCLCAYEESITSFFRLYTNVFKPLGIAAFVIEMPGIGACGRLNLNDHFSMTAENAVMYLSAHKSIDSSHIGLYGSGMSGTACIRTAVLLKNAVKAMILVAPFVNSLYTDKNILNSLPLCRRSSICNRLDLDASNWSFVIPRLNAFSLKTQGILSTSGQCRVSTYVVAAKRSVVTSSDLQLLKNHFADFNYTLKKNDSYSSFILGASENIKTFLQEKFIN
ncbi:MAG: alpha/beta hydrolase [Succinivibrio sp.]